MPTFKFHASKARRASEGNKTQSSQELAQREKKIIPPSQLITIQPKGRRTPPTQCLRPSQVPPSTPDSVRFFPTLPSHPMGKALLFSRINIPSPPALLTCPA